MPSIDPYKFQIEQIWYAATTAYSPRYWDCHVEGDQYKENWQLYQVLDVESERILVQAVTADHSYGDPIWHPIKNTDTWQKWYDGQPIKHPKVSQETRAEAKLVIIHLPRRSPNV